MRARRPLFVFFPLAFLLSWYAYILGKLHLVQTSGGINPLGPAVAALIVAGIFYRGRGLKELLARYIPWRASWRDYALALGLPVVFVAMSGAANLAVGAARPAHLPDASELIPRFIFTFVFVGLGEETGWRGFALPELQKRYSPLVASLILGAFWAAWHIPLIGVEFQGAVIPAFVISVFSGSVVIAWLFNRARGALLPIPLLHAMVNTVGAGYVFKMFTGADNTRLWWLYTMVWAAFAVGVSLASPMMRQKPKPLAVVARAA